MSNRYNQIVTQPNHIKFFEGIVKGFPVSVERINETKGRGVIAQADMEKGRVLFHEKPLVLYKSMYPISSPDAPHKVCVICSEGGWYCVSNEAVDLYAV